MAQPLSEIDRRKNPTYLSFARMNTDFARRLAGALEEAGFRIWMDVRELMVGDEWDEKVAEATRSAPAMILLISEAMLASVYINEKDIPRAIEAEVPILPLLIEEVSFDRIPPQIARLQYLHLVDQSESNFRTQLDRLIHALERFADRAEQAQVAEKASPTRKADFIPTQSAVPTPPPGNGDSNGDQPPPDEPAPLPAPSVLPKLKPESLIRALTDEPTAQDLLGFSQYAAVLADFIRDHCKKMRDPQGEPINKPLVIGIDAQWGGGKTSLMKMIQAELNRKDSQEKPFHIREFNAWLYDKEEALWAALALQLEEQIGRSQPRTGRLRLLLRRVDYTRLIERLVLEIPRFLVVLAIGLVAWFLAPQLIVTGENQPLLQLIGGLLSIGGVVGLLSMLVVVLWIGGTLREQLLKSLEFKIGNYIKQPDYAERIGFLETFRKDFARLIEESRTKDGSDNPLVIFIDDLDRCSPAKAAQIIEAISVLLDARNCVYIIGMDTRTVAAAIETRYKDLEKFLDDEKDPGGISFGEKFLEKIIQIHFKIPRISREAAVEFINKNLSAEAVEPQTFASSAPIAGEKAAIGANYDEVDRVIEQERREELQEYIAEFDKLDIVIASTRHAAGYLEFNPRKIKRFLNEFRMRAAICLLRNLLETNIISLDILALWVILETRYPNLITILRERPDFAAHLLETVSLQAEVDAPPAGITPADLQAKKRQLAKALKDEQTAKFMNARVMIDLLREIHAINPALLEETHLVHTYLYLVEVQPIPRMEAVT